MTQFAACFFPAAFIALRRIRPLAVSRCLPGAFFLGTAVILAAIGVMTEAGHFATAMIGVGLLIAGGGDDAIGQNTDLDDRDVTTKKPK